jgi:hypothetical protein
MKGPLLVALLVGLAMCVRRLALENAPAPLTLRSLTIATGLGAWFLSQALLGGRGLREGWIGDAVHDWTAPWHARLVRNRGAANALLITTSVFIDGFGLFLIGSALLGPSMRPGLALLLLFAFRQVAQATCALPAPPGMIWRHPGFPSLLVTYDVANDFFFSGHTAIAVLGAIELSRGAPGWVALAAGGIALGEAVAVLVLRAHYTMDVLTGIVAAFCAASLAGCLCA